MIGLCYFTSVYIFYGFKRFQYYGNRAKLRSIGREDDLEKLNKTALALAKKVAKKHNKLTAAGLCNTTVYKPDDEDCKQKVKDIFKVYKS